MHADDTWFKPELNKKLLKDLSRKSDWEGLKHFGIYFFFLFFLYPACFVQVLNPFHI